MMTPNLSVRASSWSNSRSSMSLTWCAGKQPVKQPVKQLFKQPVQHVAHLVCGRAGGVYVRVYVRTRTHAYVYLRVRARVCVCACARLYVIS